MNNKNLAYANRAAAVIAEPSNAVGRIKKTYGNGKSEEKGGALLVMLYDNFPVSSISSKNSNNNAEALWVEIDSLAVPLFVNTINRVGGSAKATKAIVLFDDFEREEDVEQLVGKVLYMEAEFHEVDDDDQDGEMDGLNAWIGYELTDRITGRSGIVTEFYDYTGNPVLGVDFDGLEVLVPAAEGLIKVVSDRKKRLETELAEGLFSL